MLALDFAAELEQVGSRQAVTGILSWRMTSPTNATVESLANAKRPVLEKFGELEGVRVNALPGFPQAIVVAPAGAWQTFLAQNPWLRDTEEIDIIGNGTTFHTLG